MLSLIRESIRVTDGLVLNEQATLLHEWVA